MKQEIMSEVFQQESHHQHSFHNLKNKNTRVGYNTATRNLALKFLQHFPFATPFKFHKFFPTDFSKYFQHRKACEATINIPFS